MKLIMNDICMKYEYLFSCLGCLICFEYLYMYINMCIRSIVGKTNFAKFGTRIGVNCSMIFICFNCNIKSDQFCT